MASDRRSARTDELFQQALEVPVAERTEFLNQATLDEPEIRADVERLLRIDQQLESEADHLNRCRFNLFDVAAGLFSPNINCPQCNTELPQVVEAGSQQQELKCPQCGAKIRSEDRSSSVAAGTRMGRFELLNRVGSGAFGSVWRATDTELGRSVAVKLLHTSHLVVEESQQRFLKEGKIAAQLRHPGIVGVHEVGSHDEHFYIVSDFIDGQTLEEWLGDGALAPRSAAELTLKIAAAIDHAHQAGVLHRDLKPANIMMDGNAEPLIMDFGLAKLESDENTTMTMDGRIIGTPAYMSPEQAKGNRQEVTYQSDIYSLGVILFRLATGELPFRGHPRMLIEQIIHDQPPSLRRLNHSIPRDLETICLKCLQKKSDARYKSASELADDLRRFLAWKPIRARAVGRAERIARWVRRYPARTGVLAATIVATITLSGWLMNRHYSSRLELALMREQQQLYFSRIAQADRERMSNNIGRTRQLLSECPKELRGWEWQYLNKVSRQEIASFDHQREPVLSVRFSPDGTSLVTAAEDGKIRFWDLATRRQLRTFAGHRNGQDAIAFGLAGTTLISSTFFSSETTSELKALDIKSGKVIGDVGRIEDSIHGFTVSPKGDCVAYIDAPDGRAGEIILWDVAAGEKIHTLRGHSAWIGALAFSPDGQRLVSGGSTQLSRSILVPGEFKVWDVEQGTLIYTKTAPPNPIWALAFSPDGNLIASGSGDAIRIWRASDGDLKTKLVGHTDQALHVSFVSNQVLASGSADATVKLWNLHSEEEIQTLRGHTEYLFDLTINQRGDLIATASADGQVKLWDLTVEDAFTLRASSAPVASVAYAPTGDYLASSYASGKLRIWDGDSGLCLHASRPNLVGGFPQGLAYSPDGKQIAAIGVDGRGVVVFDSRTGQDVVSWVGNEHQKITGLDFHPDGQQVATISHARRPQEQGLIQIWDTATGGCVESIDGHPTVRPNSGSIAYCADGSRLLTASSDRTARIWNTATSEEICQLRGHSETVLCAAFNYDATQIATASDDNTVILWDASSGEPIRTLRGHSREVISVMFSSDGNRLASGSNDKSVKLWDVATGTEIIKLRSNGKVGGIAFSPGGHRFAAASQDASIRVWEADKIDAKRVSLRRAARLVNRLNADPNAHRNLNRMIEESPNLDRLTRENALDLAKRLSQHQAAAAMP